MYFLVIRRSFSTQNSYKIYTNIIDIQNTKAVIKNINLKLDVIAKMGPIILTKLYND